MSVLYNKIRDTVNSSEHLLEIVRGAGFIFFAKVFGTLANLGANLIVARVYGSKMVGLVAIIQAILAVCMIFSLMGCDVAALRLIPEYLQKYSRSSLLLLQKKLMVIVLVLSLLVTFMLVMFSSPVSRTFLHSQEMRFYVLLTASMIIVKAFATLNMETIRGLQSMKIYGCMQAAPFILNFIFLAVLSFFFDWHDSPIYALFGSICLTSLLLVFYAFRLPRRLGTGNEKERKPAYGFIMSLAFPMFLTSVIFVVIYQSDTLMLGALCTEAEVGIYSIAMKLAMLTNFILISVNSTTAPKFSQIYHEGNMQELQVVAQGSTRIGFWVIMPIIVLSFIFGRQILGIFGTQFQSGYSVLLILLVGQCVNVSAGAVGLFLDMTGHEKVFRNIVMFAGTLNLVLNIILIPRYQITGAAVASMISIVCWNVMASRYIKKEFGFSISYVPWRG